MKRHLIYHVCPLKANDGWRRNLAQLAKRIDVFDEGSIAVAQGEGCEDLLEVKVEMIGLGINIPLITVDNDPVLREVASFEGLLMLTALTCRPDDAVFYAHTKGNSTKDGVQGATRWRNAMYTHLLDCTAISLCSQLRDHDAVGACKMTWDPAWRRLRGRAYRCPFPSGLQVKHQWLFAGTFFWFSARVFSQYDWRAAIRADRYGAEGWLGEMMSATRGLSVYQPRPEDTPWNPYDPEVYGAQYDD